MAIATINPATGQLLQSFEPLQESQIDQKLQLAAETFPRFRKLPFADRACMMTGAANILERDKDSLARLMTAEMGKTVRSAVDEVVKCAWACRFYAENAESYLRDEVIKTTASLSLVRYQPLGVILAVMPWNFPFWQVFRFIATGLMAGNVGLLKHASNVPQCALKIEEILRFAGFPEGAFQTLLITAKQVEQVIGDRRVAAATLTGSEGAGIEVGVGAARMIKKVVLELGGSDPFIVMPSADLDQAVAVAVKSRTLNNGQSCINAKRFVVAEEIAAEFERRFVHAMASLKVGDPMDPNTDIGPLATAGGLSDVDRDVRKSVEMGARILTGGRPLPGPGFFYPPTVLTDIPEESPAYTEELFGPVALLFRANSIEDALGIANSTRFGLGASIWTHDAREQEYFIDAIESGLVFVNGMVASDPRLPFGGIKGSGHGRELGIHGIREFMNIKTLWIQ